MLKDIVIDSVQSKLLNASLLSDTKMLVGSMPDLQHHDCITISSTNAFQGMICHVRHYIMIYIFSPYIIGFHAQDLRLLSSARTTTTTTTTSQHQVSNI